MENLATVMTLFSRRTFSKESFQWTKCVVKYLHDSYGYLTLPMVTFLVEVLERGPSTMQGAVLNILHCLLHYVDFNLSANAQQVNTDLLRVIAKYIEVCSTYYSYFQLLLYLYSIYSTEQFLT